MKIRNEPKRDGPIVERYFIFFSFKFLIGIDVRKIK